MFKILINLLITLRGKQLRSDVLSQGGVFVMGIEYKGLERLQRDPHEFIIDMPEVLKLNRIRVIKPLSAFVKVTNLI